MKPDEIEALSFKIITEEAGSHNFPPDQWQIVRRMIHTSADFTFMQSIRFHPRAIEAGVNAIRQGRTIITDTNMARVGIRQKELRLFGGTVKCLIADAGVAATAAEKGITRAKAAVDAAVPLVQGGIYAIGNAPTALLHLISLINEGTAQPAMVIGLPVGFVNAAESKSDLAAMDYPYITNIGRKGGSNLAAGVVNALLIMAATET